MGQEKNSGLSQVDIRAKTDRNLEKAGLKASKHDNLPGRALGCLTWGIITTCLLTGGILALSYAQYVQEVGQSAITSHEDTNGFTGWLQYKIQLPPIDQWRGTFPTGLPPQPVQDGVNGVLCQPAGSPMCPK